MVGGECWDEGGEFGIIRIMKNLIPLIAFGAMMLPAAARLPVLSDPVYADTEVSTNVAFNPVRSDARQFGISMDFSGTPSNCVQIAFGRDADSDGDLSADETRLVLGWRGGEYFIEDVSGRNRIVETAVGTEEGRHFGFFVKLNSASLPVQLNVTNECGAFFASLSENPPDWLYGTEWNLMKVTRRGVDALNESISVDCRYKFFRIILR